MLNAIGYVHMHTWPLIGTTEGVKQLVLPTVPKGVVCICQKLCTGHKQWYIHPMLGQSGRGQRKHLQFFAICLIHLPQLPKLVGLVHILGQPVHPEVADQRPILSYISCSPHSYCTLTGLTKLWPAMQMHAAGLSSAVLVVAMVALVTKYHRGRIIVLPTPHTWLVIQ